MEYNDINTPEGKRQFITSIFDTVRETSLNRVNDMPDNWDGRELRQYVADKMSEVVWSDNMSRGRKRSYNNTVNVKNL